MERGAKTWKVVGQALLNQMYVLCSSFAVKMPLSSDRMPVAGASLLISLAASRPAVISSSFSLSPCGFFRGSKQAAFCFLVSSQLTGVVDKTLSTADW